MTRLIIPGTVCTPWFYINVHFKLLFENRSFDYWIIHHDDDDTLGNGQSTILATWKSQIFT